MITAVAVVPTTPLALEGLPGRQHPGVAAIGAAARRATADLSGVEMVIGLAGASTLAVHAPPATDLLGYGLHLPPHVLGVPPAAVTATLQGAIDAHAAAAAAADPTTTSPDGNPAGPDSPAGPARRADHAGPDLAVLARWVPAGTACVGLTVPTGTPPAVVDAVAGALMAVAEDARVGLLVAGDLGAGHGPKPPRPGAATVSATLQDLVIAALDNGRPADLVRLDPGLATASAARAIGALRILGAVLQAARLGTVVRAADAPLGVGYVVAQGG